MEASTSASTVTSTGASRNDWETSYCIAKSKGQLQYLVCFTTVNCGRAFNLKRHYDKYHANQLDALSTEERKKAIACRKGKLNQAGRNGQQQVSFSNLVLQYLMIISSCRTCTSSLVSLQESSDSKEKILRCSYELSLKIAKSGRAYTDGAFIKECVTKSVELLCPERRQQFEAIPLSRNTVMRRIKEMATDVTRQLADAAHEFIRFSLALDEATDVTGTPHVAIFIRGVSEKRITEELLDFCPLKESTTGEDILSCAKEAVEKIGLNWEKLVSVTTDGAPSMTGKYNGFVGPLRTGLKKLGVLHNISNLHCVIHQENLCAKRIQFEYVMSVVVRTTNYIRMNGLKRRQFRTFCEELKCDYVDLPLYTEVRWLSRATLLDRFFKLRNELSLFTDMVDHDVPELHDHKWLCNLSFFSDLTDHLSTLNVVLQGKCRTIIDYLQSIREFQLKIDLLGTQLEENDFSHFQKLMSVLTNEVNVDRNRYKKIVQDLREDFSTRFQDLYKLEEYFDIVTPPFSVDVTKVPENLQLELMNLKIDQVLERKFNEADNIIEFCKNIPQCRFPHLRKCYASILAMFGSPYICEQFFSIMKITKSTRRTIMTNENLKNSLILSSC